ncbi:hypothetical protein BDW59DRAFT_167930 [Aspergillus cavernicola]|uniref:Uncharacterized protein n=1 Tax=Aspergillus cavernicola TaxID=176166 RepID=A0ABR4H9C7_9EURO
MEGGHVGPQDDRMMYQGCENTLAPGGSEIEDVRRELRSSQASGADDQSDRHSAILDGLIQTMHIDNGPLSLGVEGHRHPCPRSIDTSSRFPAGLMSRTRIKGKQTFVRRDSSPMIPAQMVMTSIRCDSEILALVRNVQEMKSFLGGLLTLTARQGVVEAMRCDTFLSKYYGEIGQSLLDYLCRAIESPGRKYECEGMKMEISDSEVVLHHHYQTPVTRDALSWLCLALRVPLGNGIHASFQENQTLSPLRPLQAPSDGDESSCWHNLFETAVVVVTDTSPSVLRNCLEINSDIMIQLAAVQYPVRVNDGLVLMGYSTALIPIQRLPSGRIKWHLEINTQDSQFKVSDLHLQGKEWYRTLSLENLRGTAVLGWSTKAEVLLGTEKLPCHVTWSSTERQHYRWELNNINLQAIAQSTVPFQIGGQAGFAFQRIPNTVRFSPSKNYTKLLIDSFNEPMILYDTEERRAWLVSKLSVFHHMLLAYCKSSGVKDKYPLASPGDDGGSASFQALLEWSEKDLVGYGGAPLRVSDLVLGFSANLSKTIVHPPKRNEIFGYEFMDIVHTTTASELGKARLKRDGLVWKPLLKNIECLFCKNLGDAIISMRSSDRNASCNQLPKGRDLLAASLFCVDEISKREGNNNQTSIRRFPGPHLWELWGDPFSGCRHRDETSDCWDNNSFIQNISREKKKFINLRHETKGTARKTQEYVGPKIGGVIVFGQSLANAAQAAFPRFGSSPLTNAQGKSNAGSKDEQHHWPTEPPYQQTAKPQLRFHIVLDPEKEHFDGPINASLKHEIYRVHKKPTITALPRPLSPV